MLAEILLILSGHSSSFFIPYPSPPAAPFTCKASPSLTEYLHPGEIASLNSLADLAFQYRKIRTWANDTIDCGRKAVLAESLPPSRKGKEREVFMDDKGDNDKLNQYLMTLAASIIEVLNGYELLIVETEARVLSFDPTVVQDQQGYVPLSSIVATFDRWRAPLTALSQIVDQLSSLDRRGDNWSPGRLIDLIVFKSQTGNPFLQGIFSNLAKSLQVLFLTHLVSFTLYGVTSSESPMTSPSIGRIVGVDPLSPQHRVYALNVDMLPVSVEENTRESILYVGRVAATLKREGKSLPKGLVDNLRGELMAVKSLEVGDGLKEAVEKARAEVGEWLWRHILTGPQVAEAIEMFGNFFLLRKTDYCIAVIRGISQLRLDRLITSNPHSSSSIIREQDLDLILRRASVGTSAEMDSQLDSLHYKLEKGPLRAMLPTIPMKTPKQTGIESKNDTVEHRNSIRAMFSSSLLGTPLILTTPVTWPLDLFISPQALSAYSDIQAYLTALRHTHLSVLSCWTTLSAAQRQRRKWTGVTEGGTDEEVETRKGLGRAAWGTIRLMLFFIDQLQSHFMTDIIDVQHKRLLEQLGLETVLSAPALGGSLRRSSLRGSISVRQTPTATKVRTAISTPATESGERRRAASPFSDTYSVPCDGQTLRSNRVPPTPNKAQSVYLDFLTLRQLHTLHLSFLREGLLIADINLASVIRDILDTCRRFAGLVERWGGDVLPELLMEGINGEEVGKMVKERAQAVQEINDTLHELLTDFFGALLDTQNPGAADPDKSIADGGSSLSRTIRAAQISRMMSRQASFTAAAMNVKKGAKSKMQMDKEERELEADTVMARHIEQLLLRLDFNGVLTAWRLKEVNGDYSGGSVLIGRGF
ncbi:hypothetical protein C343_03557 [Cryptococcus neoformans C23]|uniref:Spindle pole body component n=1 Tax=Cryptococcus neoformans (strain H99 / ATCC 208821 / CBS 10515 / FGSC 9487) TaxID=235443 RepID=J9VPY4_CRYN9|nr:hypothetical protein CNAG_02374 [Cryptococcus neoformans var. grubii H99]AUB25263.1 hypothetical protein CKF44_02374 [Cryptococcus neoformans var. grubii]OWZ31528.1 hypothetical protein C347_03620 [Cryptococcus neoformans var. grubii AD2-60a]OWZ43689.1 hypothetical protein C343_03557 [Cryptococcus neoformans var. grubii C23]OXC84345.1 hypothetical protein C344_03317 [Cryptococcus neoformans var. grubii AD1-7a]AFR95456.2 hypothetical protein CNAG_02374 [Cryptococcus neoformans var. grubii H9|eukprot:XP_012049744.1 hypothetical protein CNAG_02374 [Cryptococcus neoformans var. grubii H99]